MDRRYFDMIREAEAIEAELGPILNQIQSKVHNQTWTKVKDKDIPGLIDRAQPLKRRLRDGLDHAETIRRAHHERELGKAEAELAEIMPVWNRWYRAAKGLGKTHPLGYIDAIRDKLAGLALENPVPALMPEDSQSVSAVLNTAVMLLGDDDDA